MCPGHGPTLFFDVAALLCGASLQALSEPPVIVPLICAICATQIRAQDSPSVGIDMGKLGP